MKRSLPVVEVKDKNGEWRIAQTKKEHLGIDKNIENSRVVTYVPQPFSIGQICVCPNCRFIYVNDEPIECENTDCKQHGHKGIMCDIIKPSEGFASLAETNK